jgi:hypothetical protein
MEKKELFKRILVEFQKTRVNLIPRDLRLPVDLPQAVTLYGPRRCGKTFLFYQTIQELLNQGVAAEKILYVNFEDERILPFQQEDWELLLDSYFELYPGHHEERIFLFLDEVQEAPFWEKFVRRLSERKNFRIFLTGSSSKLFAGEIATALRGRTISYFLMPFSFREFLRARKIKVEAHAEYSPQRYKIKQSFNEFLKWGGFPEVLEREDHFKNQILQGYFDLIFYKDVVERYHIRNLGLMRDFMRYLLTQFSSPFSMTRYYRLLKGTGQRIGKDTLFEYLAFLEDVNFIKTVSLFDYSLKRQAVNPRKIYCLDMGLPTAVAAQLSENRGRYLENIAFLELLRRGKKIYYYRDPKGHEVDFLVVEKGKPRNLIQVAMDLNNPQVREREVRSLSAAAGLFDIRECFILTEDQKTEIKEGKLRISVLPLWHWLIQGE